MSVDLVSDLNDVSNIGKNSIHMTTILYFLYVQIIKYKKHRKSNSNKSTTKLYPYPK